jgi:hypothetical protein
VAMIGLVGALLTDLAAWWEKGYWASNPISVLLGHNTEKIQAAGPARLMAAIEGAPLWIGLGIAAVCLFLVGRWLENRFADMGTSAWVEQRDRHRGERVLVEHAFRCKASSGHAKTYYCWHDLTSALTDFPASIGYTSACPNRPPHNV